MRHGLLIAVLLLVSAGAPAPATAEVTILMFYPSAPTACPQPPPQEPRKIITPEGIYYEAPGPILSIHSVACHTPERWVAEVWSDYPERGGHLLRRVGEP